MHDSPLHFRQSPFAAASHASRYFPAGSADAARKSLARTIERGTGIGVLVGAAGTGKTLLCQVLAEEFRRRFTPVLLASGGIHTRKALLQSVLFELSVPYRGLEEGELRLALVDYVSPAKQVQSGLLLVVDEAHSLKRSVLDELRLLTNVAPRGEPRIRIILAGAPQLEERLATARLDSLNQRIASRAYLEAFTRDETSEYVRAAVNATGVESSEAFNDEALLAVHRTSEGNPRIINQLCDHAVLLAGEQGLWPITAGMIDTAWADLQQLPAAVASPERPSPAESGVVEFGGLDDLDSPTAAAPQATAAEVNQTVDNFADQFDAIPFQDIASAHDDEFRPAGAIVPRLDEPDEEESHPFDEHFEEEEVVFDRYSSFGGGSFHLQPQVASREGNELSGLLTPWVYDDAEVAVYTVEQCDLDHELLIVDDEASATQAEPAPHPVRVHQQNYEQLLTRLRAG